MASHGINEIVFLLKLIKNSLKIKDVNLMVRPRKWRRVCTLPKVNKFGPMGLFEDTKENTIMTVEEYETIRLMDLEELNQEKCAEAMGVARSTVQRIYDSARKKIADSLVNGKVLIIEGGNYKLCSDFEDEKSCSGCICGRHRHGMNRRGIDKNEP